jgi:hypothetical protein
MFGGWPLLRRKMGSLRASHLFAYKEETMKESIENKLEEHGKRVIEKDSLSMDDINFLIYLLNRIEMKENAAAAKAEQEAQNKLWRKKMNTMLDAVGR